MSDHVLAELNADSIAKLLPEGFYGVTAATDSQADETWIRAKKLIDGKVAVAASCFGAVLSQEEIDDIAIIVASELEHEMARFEREHASEVAK